MDDDDMTPAVPVKQLSGGERSFSSLCLVLALKEATQTPFLALDEVDVFMDERNRRVALSVLTQVRFALLPCFGASLLPSTLAGSLDLPSRSLLVHEQRHHVSLALPH